ncbi:MAG TPA: medium chain dehydrogenase/reductase family protein [Polyangiaceae bacterium]|nr:medium chain dehydrogenase/reductase family protein [Polyangiaceae bacterium]
METYRAVMLTGRGGPEMLTDVVLPVTAPGPSEVRLAVRATGAGGTDVTMRRGRYSFAPPFPFVPGYEVLGDVEAVGDAVRDVRVGDRVAALVVHGGYAEKLVLPASAVVPVPPELDDGEAVALVLNYVTAHQAIHRSGRVQPGQTALVTGASGGVGTALLELLRLAGVRVVGAASAARHGAVRELGATPIDSRGASIAESTRELVPGGVDVAFDTLGGRFVTECVRATRRGGTVVGVGFSGTMRDGVPRRFGFLHTLMSVFVGARLRGRRGTFYGITLSYRKNPEPFRQDLKTLFSLLAAHELAPRIAARLPLLAARTASELLERGGVEGKIVHLANP